MEVTPSFFVTAIYDCNTQCNPTPCPVQWEPQFETKNVHQSDKRKCKRIIKEKIIYYNDKFSKCDDQTPCDDQSPRDSCYYTSPSKCADDDTSLMWLSICESDGNCGSPVATKPRY